MTIYKDDLERVYKLIEKQENWTQKAYARDAAGELLPNERGETFEDDEKAPLRDGAACWCLYGAAIKCGIDWYGMDRALPVRNIVDFNDSPNTKHEDVLHVLREAIRNAPVRP